MVNLEPRTDAWLLDTATDVHLHHKNVRLISTDVFSVWLHTLTHVNFNHVNKTKVRQKLLSLNEKLSKVQLLRLRATFHALPLFYLRTYILRTYARKNFAKLEINPLGATPLNVIQLT